jgi:hypothetical protein
MRIKLRYRVPRRSKDKPRAELPNYQLLGKHGLLPVGINPTSQEMECTGMKGQSTRRASHCAKLAY